MRAGLLLFSDDKQLINTIHDGLKNFTVKTIQNPEGTVQVQNSDIIIIDTELFHKPLEPFLKKIKLQNSAASIILITELRTLPAIRNYFNKGIDHLLLKPFEADELYYIVNTLLTHKKIMEENIRLKQNLSSTFHPKNIIGESEPMKQIYSLVVEVANLDVNVVLYGESGTGKEMIARAIHFSSARREKPFFAINCGAIPGELLESELFGYKKGAFTNAFEDRKGLFEEADQSTIFLDEINELPLNLQPKLLRVLQEKKFKRLGDNQERNSDFRLIVASSKDLQEETARKKFREDLYYRLNVMTIRLPALRERKEDIPLLISHFINKYKVSIKKDIKGITKEALDKCMEYHWPGNIRELENTIQRALVLTKNDSLLPEDMNFEPAIQKSVPCLHDLSRMPYRKALEAAMAEVDKIFIKKALEESHYNKTKAAKILGISVRALHYKMKEQVGDTDKVIS